MANIRIDLNHAPLDGETVSFKAPCNASEVSGLIIYYLDENQQEASKEFTLNDANGSDIGSIDSIFAEGAIVKVVLDTDTNSAFVQNPDTNAYLEGRFEDIEEQIAANKGIHIGSEPPTDENIEVWIDTDEEGDDFYNTEEVDALLAGIGTGVKMELLWENASPKSAFAAQSVTVDGMSNYNLFYFAFRHGILDPEHETTALIMANRWFVPSFREYHRYMNFTETGFTAGTGQVDATTNNGAMVPWRLYGIKGVS